MNKNVYDKKNKVHKVRKTMARSSQFIFLFWAEIIYMDYAASAVVFYCQFKPKVIIFFNILERF